MYQEQADIRLKSLRVDCQAAYKDLCNGRISERKFNEVMSKAEADAEKIETAVETHKKAKGFGDTGASSLRNFKAFGDVEQRTGFFGGGKSKAVTPPDGARQIERRDDPIDLDQEQLYGMYQALKHGQPFRAECKSFSDRAGFKTTTSAPVLEGSPYPSGILPPDLRSDLFQEYRFPGAVTPVSAYLPTMQIEAPSIELPIQLSNVNAAAVVSEGGVKADVGVSLTKETFIPVKIAALGSASNEILSDWPVFSDWLPRLVANAVRDAEDQQILSGTGSPGMTGILNTSNTLTRTFNSATDDTPLDTILQGFDDIRQQPNVLGDPDLVLLHPYTWGAIRREKSTTGAFLLNIMSPNEIGSLEDLWGVPVKTSVHVPQGQGIILDSGLACRYLVRTSLEIAANPWGDTEWTQNLVSFRAELRSVIAVIRPGAINLLTGLSQSSDLGS